MLGVIAFVAMFYNLCRLYLIKYTEAHYSVIAGSIKVLLSIFCFAERTIKIMPCVVSGGVYCSVVDDCFWRSSRLYGA
jgi:hypothetical protein